MKKILLFIASVSLISNVWAWQPPKTVTAVSGFSAGSGNEVSFRFVAAQVEKNTGVNFVVVNRPGAGSAVANEAITKEKTDGSILLIASAPALIATDRMLLPNKKYGLDDFTVGIGYAGSPMVVVTNPKDPVQSFADFVKVMQTQPVAIGDPGSAARLTYEILQQATKWPEGRNHVTRAEYKGPADTLNDVMAGHIRFGIMPLLTAYQAHKANKVRIIAVTSEQPVKDLPEVATVASLYPGVHFNLVWGLVFPKNTDAKIVNWYVTEFNKALSNPDVLRVLSENQMFVDRRLLSTQGFKTWLERDEKKYAPLVDKVISQQKN